MERAAAQHGQRGSRQRAQARRDSERARDRDEIRGVSEVETRAVVEPAVFEGARARAAADLGLALEQFDVVARAREAPGAGQAGEARADHRDRSHAAHGTGGPRRHEALPGGETETKLGACPPAPTPRTTSSCAAAARSRSSRPPRIPKTSRERAAELGIPALALADRDGLYGSPRFHQAARAAGLRALVGAELAVGASEAEARRLLLLVESPRGYRGLSRLLHARARGGPQRSRAARFLGASSTSTRAGSSRSRAATRSSTPPGSRARGRASAPEATRAGPALAGRVAPPHPQCRARVAARGRDRREPRRPDRRERRRAPRAARGPPPLRRARLPAREDLARPRRAPARRERRAPSPAARRDAAPLRRPARLDPRDAARSPSAARSRSTTSATAFPSSRRPRARARCRSLRRKTAEGARRRYGSPLPARPRAQLERELALIEKLDLAGYFLIVHDIARFAREQRHARPGPRLRRQQRGLLCARDHRGRSRRDGPALRALPLRGARRVARHRHRPAVGRPAREGDPVRLREVRRARRRDDGAS